MKILIVDDRELNRKLLRTHFLAEGMKTMEAADGLQALELLKTETPDVIITDILMPNMDGYLFCRSVRERPRFDRVPLIIYTSTYVSPGDEQMALDCGADKYLRKPAPAQEIFKAVNDAVSARAQAPARQVSVSEKDVLKQYNEALIHKLEEKNQELQSSDEKFRQLVENMDQVFFLTGPLGAPMRYISPAYEKVWGRTRQSLYDAPMSWMDALLPEDRPGVEAWLRSGGSATEYRIKGLDGTVRWIKARSFPVRDEAGAVSGLCGLAEDITPLKKAEAQMRQAQKMEGIGRLAGGVAHDFNNLLTAILGFSELAMRNFPEGHAVRKDLEEVVNMGHRAAKLTSQLLAFSRKQIIEPKVISLNELIVTTDRMLRRVIGEDIDLAVIQARSLWPVQVEQVIVNLCVNARDAMPDGGKLTIETANVALDEAYSEEHPGLSPGEYVMMAVTDTGTGMTPEVKQHLFEPFFTTKEQGRGTGLGLATCYGIVKQSGGHIAVYSELGQGTTFKVYLPRTRETLSALAQPLKPKDPPGGKETILLVEDDPAVRRTAIRMLQALGYTVLEAAGGEEGLRLAKEDEGKAIRLMLTDVVMPEKSGRAVADELKALRPDIRVLFTSGYTDEAIVRHGVLEKGISFLRKPFTLDSLAYKIREVLDVPAR